MNRFKAALQARQAQIGLWLSLGNPLTAEICATAGYDWLLVDGEHGPNDVRSMLAQLQAVGAYASHPIVRPVNGDVALIKQVLDSGAQSLLVPMVDTAEQAHALVAATRYPPQGVRGVASSVVRASRWGLDADYLTHADDDICLLIQAESRRAIDNLDALCAVDGVDGIFIGPADLSASLGHRGNPQHPDVQRTIDDAIGRIVASGKAAGILSTDVAQSERYLKMGCLFVAVGLDVRLLAESARALRARFPGGDAAKPAAPGVAY